MALETPTAPTPTATETTQKPAADVRPTRARNEYPEAYDELEELERTVQVKGDPKPSSPPKPAAAPKPAPKPAPDKPAAKPPGAADPEPDKAPKPAGDKTPTDKPADDKAKTGDLEAGEPDPTAKFTTAHDLRKDWRRLHRALQDRDLELNTLRERVKETAPVSNAVVEENKSLKKRLDEVEGELRYLDYTKSSEFKDKFEKPYQDAYDDAVEEIKELRVNLPDGQSRPATAQDFQRILQADNQDVRALANELFGDAAHDVLAARRKLIDLNRTANRESKRYREQAAEREKQKTLKAAEERERMEVLWKKSLNTIEERYPEYFKPIEGDDEYNAELKAGYETVDRAHSPGLPIEEKVARLAALRHRAAAFRAQVFVNKRLKERVKELEGVVAEYEKSAPTGGKGASDDRVPKPGEENGYASAEAEIDALAAADRSE